MKCHHLRAAGERLVHQPGPGRKAGLPFGRKAGLPFDRKAGPFFPCGRKSLMPSGYIMMSAWTMAARHCAGIRPVLNEFMPIHTDSLTLGRCLA